MTAKGPHRLRIALAQMNQRVGDLAGNAHAMLEMRRRAAAEGADLLVCPELQLVGYPPEDLVLKPEFVRRAHEHTDQLVEATVEPGPAMLIGTIVQEEGQTFNAMVLANGALGLPRWARLRASVITMKSATPCAAQRRPARRRASSRGKRATPIMPGDAEGASASRSWCR